jgi:hypothetical protein
MKRPGLSSGTPSPPTSAKKAYEQIFNGDPTHTQVLHELFVADGEVVGSTGICLLAGKANFG